MQRLLNEKETSNLAFMEFTVLSAHSHHLLQTDDILLSVQNATLMQEKRAAAPHIRTWTLVTPTKGLQGANKPFPHRSRWLRVHMQDGQAEPAARVSGAERVVMPHENHHFYSSINTAPAGVPQPRQQRHSHAVMTDRGLDLFWNAGRVLGSEN